MSTDQEPESSIPTQIRSQWEEILKKEKAEAQIDVLNQYVKELLQERTFLMFLNVAQVFCWMIVIYVIVN